MHISCNRLPPGTPHGADSLCEYGLLHEDDAVFGCAVDHSISEKHGGETDASRPRLSSRRLPLLSAQPPSGSFFPAPCSYGPSLSRRAGDAHRHMAIFAASWGHASLIASSKTCSSITARSQTGERATDMCAERVEQPYWYAMQTRSRHEKVVRDQLAAKSLTPLLPLQMAVVQIDREAWQVGALPHWHGLCVRTTDTSPTWKGQGCTLVWKQRRAGGKTMKDLKKMKEAQMDVYSGGCPSAHAAPSGSYGGCLYANHCGLSDDRAGSIEGHLMTPRGALTSAASRV